jgi:hypothetical protein
VHEPAGSDHESLTRFASKFPYCGKSVLTFDGTPNYVLSCNPKYECAALIQKRSGELAIRDIARAYGPERLKRTTFAMLLCDPAQRAQSFTYYHTGQYDHRGRESWNDFRSKAAGDLNSSGAFTGGLYGAQADLILRELGSLVIIPAPIYCRLHMTTRTLLRMCCL